MSNFPTIPEFINTQEDMATALRAVKQALEILAGLRQGEALGAPQVYVQISQPSAAKALNYKKGDIWINTGTNVLSYWTGATWQAIA